MTPGDGDYYEDEDYEETDDEEDAYYDEREGQHGHQSKVRRSEKPAKQVAAQVGIAKGKQVMAPPYLMLKKMQAVSKTGFAIYATLGSLLRTFRTLSCTQDVSQAECMLACPASNRK